MQTYILKSYYGEIFFDFVLQDEKADAVIILPGFPSNNDFSDLIRFFYEKGYHVFVPRYKGSYQSRGIFMKTNPVDDMVNFLDELEKGRATSLWDGTEKRFEMKRKILLTGSFGGPIGLGLAAKTGKFSHIILTAPVWDYRKHNEKGDEQSFVHITGFVTRAYENCYRFDYDNIMDSMKDFKELNPEYYLPLLEDFPILVMHDPNDKTVSIKHSREMVPFFNKGMKIEHYFGHVASDNLFVAHWKQVEKFIHVNYVQ